MTSFYTIDELKSIGLKSYGENVLISRKVSIYGAKNIEIGNNVRIDDFCILSGKIKLGSYIHISAYCAIYGAQGVSMEDYTGLSARCTLYSAVDDFSGDYLIGPMIEEDKTNVTGGEVIIRKYSQVGAGCTIMPNLTIEEGVAVGAMSFINKSLQSWGIYAGIPAIRIKDRNIKLLELI